MITRRYDTSEVRKRVFDALPGGDAQIRRRMRWGVPFDYTARGVLQPVWRRGRWHLLVSVENKPDGHPWLHVSVSTRAGKKLPPYDLLSDVRACFFPVDRHVIHVWPPVAEHSSTAEVLHLWCRIEGPALIPDLRLTEDTGEVGV